MKISVDVDCTPEEARRFMGLPDLAPLHDVYLDRLKQAMGDGAPADLLEQVTRAWAPMGEAGLSAWRGLVEQLMRGAAKP